MPTELTINDRVGILAVLDSIEDTAQDSSYTEHEILLIKTAVEEALVNAITHRNHLDPDKRVFVVFHATPDRFEVTITDEGRGFDLAAFDAPDPTNVIIEECPRGRGLLLMRTFMTEVRFHGRGNIVTLAKVRNVSA